MLVDQPAGFRGVVPSAVATPGLPGQFRSPGRVEVTQSRLLNLHTRVTRPAPVPRALVRLETPPPGCRRQIALCPRTQRSRGAVVVPDQATREALGKLGNWLDQANGTDQAVVADAPPEDTSDALDDHQGLDLSGGQEEQSGPQL